MGVTIKKEELRLDWVLATKYTVMNWHSMFENLNKIDIFIS